MPRALFVGFVTLLLNSAYLAAFADPSLWYYANVALHPILGLALAVAVVAKKGTGVVFERGPRKATSVPVLAKTTPVPFFAGAVALTVGLVLGVLILFVGATRSHAVLVYAHVVTSTLGAGLVAAYIWRKASHDAPGRLAWTVRASFAAVLAGRDRRDGFVGGSRRHTAPRPPDRQSDSRPRHYE